MLKLGCHLSIAKGFYKAGVQAVDIGANTFQFFTRNPRGGKAKKIDLEDVRKLSELMEKYNFAPLFAHAAYTMNLCSDKEETRDFARAILKDDLERLRLLPESYYIFHPGSHVNQGSAKGIEYIVEALNEVVTEDNEITILIEGMSGKGTEIGKNMEEIKAIIDGVKYNDKLGCCLDTCHLYSAGFDIVDDLDGVIEKIDKDHSPLSILTLTVPESVGDNRQLANTGPKIIAVTSGKGGVGKTNFVINVAIALAQKGVRTFIIDADLGTANIDVLLNLHPRYTLQDLIEGTKDNILDIIVEGPEGVQVVPGGSGFQSLADLSERSLAQVIEKFEPLQDYADVILIDTGAGLSRNVIKFVLAADEVIVITTTEPHAITDAYAIIKVLDDKDSTLNIKLIVNRAESKKEAVQIMKRMESVVERFLSINLASLGYISEDSNIKKAVKNLTPLIKYSPHSLAAKSITRLADKINPHLQSDINKKSFLAKLKKIFT